jgi:hypothetical protein
MKHLSIEEMHIQHIHSKTRTQFFVTSIWRMFDSIHPELIQMRNSSKKHCICLFHTAGNCSINNFKNINSGECLIVYTLN